MRHNNCYYCGKNGFIFKSYRFEDLAIVADIRIEKKHEGWPGIPHGGLAMTTFIELIDIAKENEIVYPYEYKFRFAGEQLSCGDTVRCIVQRNNERQFYGIFGKSLQLPYCHCWYTEGDASKYGKEVIAVLKEHMDASTPFIIPSMSTQLIMPYEQSSYQRIYYIKDYEKDKTYLIVRNENNGFASSSDGSVHNGVLATLLDETMGWSTFLSVWEAGVTVELQITVFDRVMSHESFYVIGFCDTVRGVKGKKITTAYGGVLLERCNELVVVALAYGRWLIRPGFKELMLQYLHHYYE